MTKLTNAEITYSGFQQDDATVHTANKSIKLLEGVFGDWVISKGLWLPQSPELNPLDYFLWRAVKQICTIEQLQAQITAYIWNISKDRLVEVLRNLVKHCHICINIWGDHFEHRLCFARCYLIDANLQISYGYTYSNK